MKILSNIHSNNIKSLRFIGAVLLFLSTTSTPLYADIVIKGDVYGGGREGAVGTGNTTTAVNAAKESVAITDATYKATNITVNAGQVRTVFGGGQEGRTFGSTDVQVNAGEIGSSDWEGTIHGGLFGAGDGNGALVFGGSNVEINGGTIVQNVYGGGNEAELIGTTSVNLKGGDLQAAVYGGARVANIYGYSLVNVNGAEAANDMIIGAVYGGNDIAGNITIPNGTNWLWIRGNNLTLPTLNEDATKPISNNGYGIDKSWNAFVVSSHSASHKVYVAQLYGGGNGEYNYTGNPGNETMSELNERVWNSTTSSWDISAHSFTGLASRPEVSKVYLELKGGNFGYVYGGGNNATVTSETVICLNNTTANRYELNADKMRGMGINLDVDKAAYKISGTDATPKYQFDRVFGGNKNADMAIHPKWHLNQGTINALYSGGDAGDMTYENGLMLVLSSPDLEVNNVYGGCRRADVIPSNLALINNNEYEEPTTGIKFPQGYSARVLVTAGTIGNVYGGNDISGDVFGGNAIEIRSSITGSVYGGGNGSYVYTDKESLANDPTYGDFYYANYSDSENTASVNSLNKFRPHTSKSYIHVAGTENAVTEIDAVYGGGNSATVSDAINLVLGTYTQIGNVFLGSNGLDMVNKKTGGTLNLYKTNSNLDLTNSDIFNTYMQGAAVSCMPVYTFDDSYPRTYDAAQDSKYAHIGSFYCGGNVGSMTSAANFDISFAKPIIIKNKLVGGCNDAFVEETTGLNARNEGGFTVKPASGAKIHLTVNGVIFANSVDTTAGNQGNIFGGCFNSGIINGDVVIDLLQNIIPSSSDINTGMDTYLADREKLFYTPFSVFGGGYGKDATIKGNTTININGNSVSEGKAFKVFGGGYGGTIDGNTTVSLVKGEIGKLYGGGFEGPVTGNTALYLTGGSVYDTFGGSCNADIDGYAQTFAGTGLNNTTGSATIRNNIYGGNDFGGSINGFGDFYGKVTETGMVYNPSGAAKPAVTQASAYVEYVSGVITNYIFGGSCGNYDYNNDAYTSHKNTPNPYPFLGNAFVNFKPNSSTSTTISKVFGAGQGYSGESASASEQDKMQNRSYVHVDIPEGTAKFNTTEFFGAGAYSGIGMGINPSSAGFHADSVSAVIDLVRGEIKNAYGGGYEEGVTRRTVVNVPVGSKIKANEIFGGAYGVRNNAPCDVYESQVNYRSDKAVIEGVFGGNNNKRRTLYAHVNIYSKALASSGNPPIFGAGKGEGTWAQYTEVNLMDGAGTYNVYGGGNAGRVLNIESVKALTTYTPDASETAMGVASPANYYRELGTTWYRDDVLDPNQIHTHTVDGETIFTNTNVNINEGATGGYIYGAGLGPTANVSGSTFIHLNGGNVTRDIYGSGSQGSVLNKDKLDFKAQTWVFAEGGTARNLYGGGWKGSVGYHDEAYADTTNDVLGYSNVIVGKIDGTGFLNGIPAIQRNVYGGGEGGTIYGKANVTVNKGYVGFRYENNNYVQQLDDAKPGDNLLDGSGNVFGGGYVINSFVDSTNVKMYGGTVRGNIYGGGEVGPIGRGNVRNSQNVLTLTPFENGPAKIYKPGHTHVELYGGHVMRNVFGGGRGTDSWGGKGDKFMDQMMSQQEIDACDWDSRGFIFGQTEVFIRGGEVGTTANVALGYGNVFGGGDLGYVYSGSGKRAESGAAGLQSSSTLGYYYEYEYKQNGSSFKTYTHGSVTENRLTDDSRVIVEPWAIVTGNAGVTLGDTHFNKGEYIPTDYLDKLKNKNLDEEKWGQISLDGVIIRNAVFAGGNVSAGSDVVYANTNTVLGNATAVLRDVYNRDLITIGTEHTGGLYGDGNLTLVDGYRELNITNYGTDYFSQPSEITLDDYRKMNDREKAYYELKFKCLQTCEGKDHKTYNPGKQLTAQEYKDLFEGTQYYNSSYWEECGFVSIYAGRLLNTIQRADFCGIFGSRMVLQGARDRVPEIVDYTDYTVNRVGEISLNKVNSQAGDTEANHTSHGNYFGIYSIVNFLGALTSDVNFNDVRQYDNSEASYAPTSANQTYYQWKVEKQKERKRNNGSSANKVALASGVYLELTSEEGTKQNKVWGPITGVVELDLINVMVGLGGGYVYAKNIHGVQQETHLEQTILSNYNLLNGAHAKAVTNKAYKYSTPVQGNELQTSGNFIHPQKQIVDDCYPGMNSYLEGGSPAHYWYIKGSIYVYDQYISAYTGAANAYAESVNIPLTISAQSHGKIQLLDIKPSKYAFYSSSDKSTNLRDDDKDGATINNMTYHLNDTISYWDWCLLGPADQSKFVDTTYVTIAKCFINDEIDTIPKGYVMLPYEYRRLKASVTDSILNVDTDSKAEFDFIFRPSNNLSHNTGYILTYDINNPMIWDKYYTNASNSGDKKNTEEYGKMTSGQSNYLAGPTYTPDASAVYGQRLYNVDDIIPGSVYTIYEGMGNNKPTEGQAQVERAYVVTSKIEINGKQLNPGAGTYPSFFTAQELTEVSTKMEEAYLCTSTIELGNDEYIYYGELIPASQYGTLTTANPEYTDFFDAAWYCTEAGKYGGNYYTAGTNYRGIETWSSMSEADRAHFSFNYDALDVLIDPRYRGDIRYYDSEQGNSNILYSKVTPVDYVAIYKGTQNLTYGSETVETVEPGDTLLREDYESIPNEQYHYAPVRVEAHASDTTLYIVNTTFQNGGTILPAGKTVTETLYSSVSEKEYFDKVTLPAFADDTIFYYCRDGYTVNELGEGKPVTSAVTVLDHNGATKIAANETRNLNTPVEPGFIITYDNYIDLVNKQKDFTVQGTAPVGTSTLVVSRESDIFSLSKGKVLTLIYQYDYEESDETGTNIEPISEKHVVNIHINFKSGIPYIDELLPPTVVLPGSTVGLKVPNVTPGAYEIIGSGWEVFANPNDAEHHKNGIPYVNNYTPMYWYQDGYLVAYYTKTYLGKTYSNTVPFTVANYHRMNDVMNSKHNETVDDGNGGTQVVAVNDYMYLDDAVQIGKHDPKVYIKDASELAQFNTFFGLTKGAGNDEDSEFYNIANAGNIDFILDGDIDVTSTWSPIGDGSGCFAGKLHGDGHTISGLDNSLFGSLCGYVYNLGVTGSFTGSGIADAGSGSAVNCWVITTGTVSSETSPILGGNLGEVENSYYLNDYKSGVRTDAHQKGLESFLNGEVAYNLNKFYLTKRYYDHNVPSSGAVKYTAWSKEKLNVDGAVPDTAYYPNTTEQYVENRYIYPDFIYAGGYIPESNNIRDDGSGKYSPIYPDDYIYFGQKLTYDIVQGGGAHQTQPGVIKKSSGLIVDDATGTRVFRTPAYFGNKEQSKVYFNSYAAFKDTYNSTDIHKSMTAIDFTEYNDTEWSLYADNDKFFTPLTDYNGLRSYVTDGLTQNMLVYFTQNKDQNSVLRNYYHKDTEMPFAFSNDDWGTVEHVSSADIAAVKGHLVEKKTANGYEAFASHFLVDKQDFNAPIEYKVPAPFRMWYQRVPGTYIESMVDGWEAISLPFTAEVVTTHQKGEITHFFEGSKEGKVGHEYWLRKYTEVDDTDNSKLLFSSPAKDSDNDKYVRNTFLWDYYYKYNDKNDANTDDYQQQYYNEPRTISDYPRYAAGVPYLIGFPGVRYYEFDLSGEWKARNTATPAPAELDKQYITFASANNGTTIIKVTDDEYEAKKMSDGKYTYMPIYQTKTLAGATTYLLNQAGSAFQNNENSTLTTVPFRAYFTYAGSPAQKRAGTRADALYIGYAGDDDQLTEIPVDRGLIIYGNQMNIVVESTLEYAATVTVTSVAGKVLKQFTIQPGTKVTVPVQNRGVYIVNRHKIAVTR